jgi:ferrochelatase
VSFDHILLIGYGAPVKTEEVMPYLRAMSAGRGVPEDRLAAIAKNYEAIGGGSPYNRQVSDFKASLEKELRSAGIDLPVFIAMKNWAPFLKDVLPEILRKGHKRGLAIPLTPFRSAAAGAGYKESLEFIISSQTLTDLSYQFIEGWHDQPSFIEAEAESVSEALQTINPPDRAGTSVLFSFHSLPAVQDPADPMSHYAEEARASSALVAERLGHQKWAVVYQSRPASACEDWPTRPRERAGIVGIPVRTVWLGPEIGEEVKALAAQGEKRIVVVPLGFLCDHAEILYDLDHQTRAAVEGAGMEYLRSKTVLSHPKVVTLIRTLVASAVTAAGSCKKGP